MPFGLAPSRSSSADGAKDSTKSGGLTLPGLLLCILALTWLLAITCVVIAMRAGDQREENAADTKAAVAQVTTAESRFYAEHERYSASSAELGLPLGLLTAGADVASSDQHIDVALLVGTDGSSYEVSAIVDDSGADGTSSFSARASGGGEPEYVCESEVGCDDGTWTPAGADD
jgi:hypothetical protein